MKLIFIIKYEGKKTKYLLYKKSKMKKQKQNNKK